MENIKLGSRVKDVITGFSGIATQRIDQLGGNIQYAIQPETLTGDAYPEGMCIDHHTIDVIDDGVSARATPAKEITINLGEVVEDKASGLTGIAVQRATYINGCISYAVVPKIVTDGLMANNVTESWMSQDRLEVIGQGITPAAPVKKNVPGGPPSRTMSIKAHRQ